MDHRLEDEPVVIGFPDARDDRQVILLIGQMTSQKEAFTALEYDYKKATLEVSNKKSQRF